MTKTKKRLFVSLAFLVVAMLVTATTTFAWFSYNEKVTVSGMEMSVTSRGSLLIADGWKSGSGEVAGSWSAEAPAAANFASKMELSAAANTGVKLNDCTLTSNKLTGRDGADLADKSYYEYQVWLKSDSTATKFDVRLNFEDSNATTLTSQHSEGHENVYVNKGVKTEADYYAADKTFKAGDVIDAAAQNAARVGIWIGDAEAPVLVWNPYKKDGYSAKDLVEDQAKNGHNLASDWGNEHSQESKSYHEETSSLATGKKDDEVACAANTVLIEKLDTTAQKVIIRVWLEGTDADCFNAIFTDTITASIGFVATAHIGD